MFALRSALLWVESLRSVLTWRRHLFLPIAAAPTVACIEYLHMRCRRCSICLVLRSIRIFARMSIWKKHSLVPITLPNTRICVTKQSTGLRDKTVFDQALLPNHTAALVFVYPKWRPLCPKSKLGLCHETLYNSISFHGWTGDLGAMGRSTARHMGETKSKEGSFYIVSDCVLLTTACCASREDEIAHFQVPWVCFQTVLDCIAHYSKHLFFMII